MIAQVEFGFVVECVRPYVRPAVLAYNPWRATRAGNWVDLVLGSEPWAHNPGHSGQAGLNKWLEWAAPLSGGVN